MFDFVIKSSKGSNITMTQFVLNHDPQGFDNPVFVFFDPIKCHISSNSISRISPEISGSGGVLIASNDRRRVIQTLRELIKGCFGVQQNAQRFFQGHLRLVTSVALNKIEVTFFAPIAPLFLPFFTTFYKHKSCIKPCSLSKSSRIL